MSVAVCRVALKPTIRQYEVTIPGLLERMSEPTIRVGCLGLTHGDML